MPHSDLLADPETESQAPQSSQRFPNNEGVFENYEKVMITGLPVKTCGEFYIAAFHVADVPQFFVGYFLLIRQPANQAKALPSLAMPHFPTRAAAFGWLVEEIAAKFFSDHKGALAKLREWWAEQSPKPLFLAKATKETKVEPSSPTFISQPSPPSEPSRDKPVLPSPTSARYAEIPLEDIEPNPANPRREYPEPAMVSLTLSIAAQGLLQAIVVRDLGAAAGSTCSGPRYRIIMGQRRWLAHQRLKRATIEAKIVSGVDDATALAQALIENDEREPINTAERAEGYASLVKSGWDRERIAQETGCDRAKISRLVTMVELPPGVFELIRFGQLSETQAWPLARWKAWPAACEVIGATVASEKIAGRDLVDAGDKLLPTLALALRSAKLAVDVTSYADRLGTVENNSVLVRGTDRTLWHLAPDQWKAEKADLDREQAEKNRRAQEKADARVAAATEAKVNLQVADLEKSGVTFRKIPGDELRYVVHLPADLFSTGIDEAGAEVVICLKPEAYAEKLGSLKQAEEALFAADRAKKVPLIFADAMVALKKLKRIGGREVAWLVDAANQGCAGLDGRAFSKLGVTVPESLTRQNLAQLDPVDLFRVWAASWLMNSTGGELLGGLRWVLGVETLGLAEEYPEAREQVLAEAALKAFPKITTVPAILAQWAKARELGMPIAEIARSYHTTEADVAGALGERLRANTVHEPRSPE